MGMGSLFDFSTQSTSYSLQSEVTNTDSNNRSQSESSVLDNVGNLTFNLGSGGASNDIDRWLPIIAVGLLMFALFK